MRPEAALFIETPMPKGCITCKKLNLKCDTRKPSCKRCTISGRSCEGYVCVSTARKPTDVTPDSILEFRHRCLPSREHPTKALISLPAPHVADSFARVAGNGLGPGDDFMIRVVRAVLSCTREETEGEREKRVVRFHEPVKEAFELQRRWVSGLAVGVCGADVSGFDGDGDEEGRGG